MKYNTMKNWIWNKIADWILKPKKEKRLSIFDIPGFFCIDSTKFFNRISGKKDDEPYVKYVSYWRNGHVERWFGERSMKEIEATMKVNVGTWENGPEGEPPYKTEISQEWLNWYHNYYCDICKWI